ncbi:MAG: electron transfer flavoprotein subunit beta/FixA family protein [Chloroflexota bacterium]|nr:electron transfer flavoprotein subunit beta/FixA family protein [Chloroflexota bacterium]
MKIAVLAKQVIDPETPLSAFKIDPDAKRVVIPPNLPPVVNGFDEQAVEAALRVKEAQADVSIAVITAGASFAPDVVKKPLAMGADQLVLIEDPLFDANPDPLLAIDALAAAVRRLGGVELVIAGRQASDWDNAQVPIGVAEALGWPIATVCQRVEVSGGKVVVERVMPDGHEVVEAPLPAVVTVSNELGNARYPNMRGIMAAKRVEPARWSLDDLGVAPRPPAFELTDLRLPQTAKTTELIMGEDDADAGRKLAAAMREANLL